MNTARRILALKAVRRIALVMIALGCLYTIGAVGWHRYRADAGEPSERLADDWFTGHRVLDRQGELLRELPTEDDRRGRALPLQDVGERMIVATLAAEDADFYDHDGVDRFAILRAAQQNIRNGRLVSGASTITQQLVKLLDTRGIPGERNAGVKLREAARAQNLEATLDKEAILEAYLNRLPYGHGLTGPEAAAQAYFGVRCDQLSWAQATYLAVLPRAPSFLDPYRHHDRVRLRQLALLAEMLEGGVIDADERARAEAEPIVLRPLQRAFTAPHFVQTLRTEDRLRDGEVTHTTLDAAVQRDVEGLVATHMVAMTERGANDAAVIVVDNATGDVIGWVGSTDFWNLEIAGQVDMVRGRRQPGSALKPFVYALAFDQGVATPAQMLADVPTEFVEGGGEIYAPKNFHGDFVGPVSAREALAASLNVPVVRLASALPPGSLLELLHGLGFASLDRSAEHYGLALALGAGEVELRELAAAYVALARGGEAIALRYTNEDAPPAPVRVLDRAVAAAVTEALADPMARVRLLQGRSPFDIGYPLALKTGTSSGNRDAWTVGFTHERTVAVWIGNADGSAMHDVAGATGAGPLFADVMRRAMRDLPTRQPLYDPSSLVIVDVCPLSGLPVGPACPDAVARRFVPDHVPSEPCHVHRHVHAHYHGGYTCAADGDAIVAVMPEAFDRWLETLPPGAPGKDPYGTPWVSHDDVQACGEAAEGGRPMLTMVTPAHGAVVLLGDDGRDRDRVELTATFDGPREARPHEVEFLVDGRPVGRSTHPYRVLVAVTPGDHEVIAIPTDGSSMAFTSASFSAR
jgi:penicillin-binding protein 1C